MAFKKSILPTFARTQTYTDISDKFVKVGLSQHSAPELNALAKAQGCHISRVSYLRQSLYAECVRRPDCADGRLPFDDARALAIAGPIDDLGDPDVLLRNALDAGVVDRRWGHLYLPGFKELYPIRHAHERAKLARAKRDRPQLMAKARAYRRAYLDRHPAPRRTKAEEDLLLPSKASPQGPDSTEVKPTVTANIRGRSGGLMPPRSGNAFVAKRSDKDLTKISPPSGDAFYEVLDAHSSKSPRLKSSSSPDQHSDAGLRDLAKPPTAPLAADEPLTLKPGKNLPLGGPSTTLSANTVVATEKRAPSAQSVPTQAHTRQNRRMEPPDDLDEGYFTSLEQSDGPNHGLLGGMAKAQRPQPIVEHPSSQPPRPPQPPVAALNEQQARPRATATSGRPPRAPWQTAMPAEAASTHRVVSASTPPSQVRHTTPSPAMNDAENDAAAAESLRAAEAVKNPPPLSAERESEIDVGRRAIAEILAKLR